MHDSNISRLDLNLLKVFAALHQGRSVTAAGKALALSQSTVSHALARLREALGDPLFVRGSRGIQPTPYADAIAPTIAQALIMVQEALERHSIFDPGTSQRTFRLLMTDMGEALFVPPLMARVRECAPGVRIVVDQRPRDAYRTALADGEADLALGQLPAATGDLFQQSLSEEPFHGFARAGHPILADPSMEQFLAAEHLAIGAPAVAEMHLVQALGPLAQRRRVALEMRHYLAAGPVLAATDLIAVLPRTVTRMLTADGSLSRFTPPFAIEPVSMRQFWHARSSRDPGCQWLREQIAALFQHGAAGLDPI